MRARALEVVSIAANMSVLSNDESIVRRDG